jgi:hypothetical protein
MMRDSETEQPRLTHHQSIAGSRDWLFQPDNFGTRTGEYINQFRVRRRIDWSQ